MEDMNFGSKSTDTQTTTSSDGSTEKLINAQTTTSSDRSREKWIDTLLPISIDAILPEAGKSVLTYFNNGKVVLGDQKGLVCNASNQMNIDIGLQFLLE